MTFGEAVGATRRFSGRALVLEDEDTVRRLTERLLAQLGFEVQTAPHGAEALELARRAATEGRPFRVALLDLTIAGGLGAMDIADDLRRVSPGVRLILSSGYGPEGGGKDWDARLQKPYTFDELSAAVDQALDESRPRGAR